MANSLNEYLQDMLVSESLAMALYSGEPEYVILDSEIVTEIYLKSEVR